MSRPLTETRIRVHHAAGRLAIAATLALCLAALSALLHSAGSARAAGPQPHPNIIVITTDDQSLSMLSGKFMPKTFKQIAQPGTTFTNAIVTTPLCCPSRATMLTGQYAHNHGVTSNRLAYAALEEKINTLPAWLHRAGYKTAHVGKYLNGYEGAVGDPREVAPGWDLWYTMLGSTRYYSYDVAANGRQIHFGQRNDDYVTRVINHRAATWAGRRTRGKKPLYLQVDHRTPH